MIRDDCGGRGTKFQIEPSDHPQLCRLLGIKIAMQRLCSKTCPNMKHGEGGGKYFQSSDDKSIDLIFIFVLSNTKYISSCWQENFIVCKSLAVFLRTPCLPQCEYWKLTLSFQEIELEFQQSVKSERNFRDEIGRTESLSLRLIRTSLHKFCRQPPSALTLLLTHFLWLIFPQFLTRFQQTSFSFLAYIVVCTKSRFVFSFYYFIILRFQEGQSNIFSLVWIV